MEYCYTEVSSTPDLNQLHIEVATSEMRDKSIVAGSWDSETQILKVQFTNELLQLDVLILETLVATII